jgi:hypothetical protein
MRAVMYKIDIIQNIAKVRKKMEEGKAELYIIIDYDSSRVESIRVEIFVPLQYDGIVVSSSFC